MTYTSADAAYAAIRAKAKTAARLHGGTVDEWWHRFVFQRFLARVFTADADGWFLKGGQALLVRNPTGRYSHDIDLYRDSSGTRNEAVAALRAAVAYDLGDFMRFEFAGRDDHADENRVARVTFAVIFGSRRHNAIGVD
ncbi:MAG: nucleotidyl transferase AbiEii/AbiGii toxin family protein, partial [Mycobacteriales bacterium]